MHFSSSRWPKSCCKTHFGTYMWRFCDKTSLYNRKQMSRIEYCSEITQLMVNKRGCYLCGQWGNGPEHKNTCVYVSWSLEQDSPHLINVIYCISLASLLSGLWCMTWWTLICHIFNTLSNGTENNNTGNGSDRERVQMNSLGELARPVMAQ